MHTVDKESYLRLIRGFLSSEIHASEFQTAYMKLWKQDRDATHSESKSWSERFDMQLITAFERGEISREDFEREWSELWGYADDVPFAEMKDNVFTACDAFEEDSEIRDQIYGYDEKQFRAHVRETLNAYETQG